MKPQPQEYMDNVESKKDNLRMFWHPHSELVRLTTEKIGMPLHMFFGYSSLRVKRSRREPFGISILIGFERDAVYETWLERDDSSSGYVVVGEKVAGTLSLPPNLPDLSFRENIRTQSKSME